MNRLIKIAWVVLLCPLFLVSCSSDDEGEKKIDLTFNAVPRVSGALDIASLAGTPVKFTEVRSQKPVPARCHRKGTCFAADGRL